MKPNLKWRNVIDTEKASLESEGNYGAAVRAQIYAVFNKLPLILLADFLVGTYFLIALLFMGGGWKAISWFGILVLSCGIRAAFVYGHKRNPGAILKSTKAVWNFVLSGAVIGGIVWSAIWLFLSSEAGLVEFGLVVLWQCGVLAGAAASLSISRKVFFAFITPPIVVTFISLGIQDASGVAILSGAFLAYVLFIVPLGLHIGSELNRGIAIELTNLSLEKELNRERKKLEQQDLQIVKQKAREKDLLHEKILADKKLLASAEERLLLLESIEEGIFGINSIGKVTFLNSSALGMLDYNEDDIVGEKVTRIIRRRGVRADTYLAQSDAITSCYQKGHSSNGIQGEFVGKGKKILPVRFSCWPINKEGRIIGAVVSFSDISKQREMEALLIQSQKMEAIGRITGSVSHDFNNLLTVIMGNLQFLRKHAIWDDRSLDLISRITTAARRGSDLVSRLLSYSKDQELILESHDINNLLLETKGFLTRVLGENIILELSMSSEDCFARTDKTQLQNAILNLCVNARDAMPEGGRLNISANKVRPAWGLVAGKPGASYIEISVRDNGVGMSDEVQEQIFEPFFTTKESDKGSGLGLSTVYGFLQQSGGNITVKSTLGNGTTFNLYLEESEPSKPIVEVKPETSAAKYHGTILVVEDDDNVRSVAAHMLVDAGFEVVTAKDGKSGLLQFHKHPEIDLIFSDIMMPGGMTGIEMAQKILKKRPDAPILLATGYAEKVLRDSIPQVENVICVPKPYDTNEIPKVAHSLIDKVAS